MGTNIGALVIDLKAETASFNANLKKASATLNSEAATMRRAIERTQASVDSLVGGFKAIATAVVVGEIGQAASAALDYASSLGEVSQQLGVTAEDLQVYRYAATQVGVSQEEMDKGLAKLTKTLGAAQLGSKSAAEVFAALGVSLRGADGQFRSTGDVLPEIAQALSGIRDPARRAAIEVELFGRAGQKLDTLLAGGAGEINNLRNAARDLGVVLSSDQIQRADATADKLAEVKLVLESRFAGVVADNADSILRLANALAELSDRTAKFVSQYSRLAGALAGAAVGATFGGGPGALVGAGVGFVATDSLAPESDAGRQMRLRDEFVNRASKLVAQNAKLSEQAKRLAYDRIAAEGNRRYGIEETSILGIASVRSATGTPARPQSRRGTSLPALPVLPPETAIGDLMGGGGGRKGGSGASAARAAANAQREAYREAVNWMDDLAAFYERRERELNDLLRDIVDTLDPGARAAREYSAQLDGIGTLVAAGRLSDGKALQLRVNATIDYAGDGIQQQVQAMLEATPQIKEFRRLNADVAESLQVSWAEASRGVAASFSGLANSIKGGGGLDILASAVDLITQLGSIGLFGKGVQKNLLGSVSGARAMGGPVSAGSTYLVGEKGPELFTPTVSGRIVANDNLSALARSESARLALGTGGRMGAAMGSSVLRVVVEKNDMFDVTVERISGAVVERAAPGIAAAGGRVAQASMARRQSRMLA